MKCINESEICYLKYEKVFGIKNNMNIHMWNELKNIIDDEINEINKETSRYAYKHMYLYGFVTIQAIMKKLECELENISLKEAGYS